MKVNLLPIVLLLVFVSCSSKNWKDASRESAGIAPKASELKEDIFQIYYARAYSWRGWFGVHPWVAWKKKQDKQYSVAQVTAWNIRREGKAVSYKQDLPDRYWFDSKPTLLFEAKGKKASIIIEKVKRLIKEYPFKDRYRVWPGPNSNTFVAYLTRNVEEITIDLPANGVGKDYLAPGKFLVGTSSNQGFQFSLFGVLGFMAGKGEGLELNLLGLSFGIDLYTPALRLPFIGRLGFADKALEEKKK